MAFLSLGGLLRGATNARIGYVQGKLAREAQERQRAKDAEAVTLKLLDLYARRRAAQQAQNRGQQTLRAAADRATETARHNRVSEAIQRRREQRLRDQEGGAGSPGSDTRAADAREQYFQHVAQDAIQAAGGDEQQAIQMILDNPETRNLFSEGMSGRHIKAAKQAFGERPAVRGGNAPDTFTEQLQAAMGAGGGATPVPGTPPAAPAPAALPPAPAQSAAPAMASPPPVPASEDPRQQAIYQAAQTLNQQAAALIQQGVDPARVRAALAEDLQALAQQLRPQG